MAVLDAKKTHQSLLNKGFVSGKGDHKFLELYYNGKFILHTKISHGEKELESFHIGMMSRQCKLDKKNFIDLANCPLSADKYLEILKTNGVITPDDERKTTSQQTKSKQKRK
jgi:hypothetical protein